MKVRHLGAATLALVLGAGGVLVAPLAASAHTPTASATCTVLTVNATQYELKPATEEIPGALISAEVLEQPIVQLTPVIPASAGQPFIAAIPDTPEISHTEYMFVHKFDFFHLNPKWKTDPNWNADGNPNSTGWISTGDTRTVVDQAFVAGTPGQPYVAPTDEVPATYSEYVAYQPAVYGEPTPGQPADATPNTVVVTIDGDVVEDTEFGTSFSDTYTFDNSFVAHEWQVVITAWNDLDGAHGWTKTIEGTSTPCYDTSLRPGVSHTQDCGVATLTFTNPTRYAFAGDYRVDGAAPTHENYYGLGPFYTIVNMPAGSTQTVTLPFVEDTGEHTVSYRIGLGAESDWYVGWVDLTIDSDCAANPEAVPPTYTEWVDSEFDCDDTAVTQTRVRTDTTWASENGEWVSSTTDTTETQTRELTSEELDECAGPQPEDKVVTSEWVDGEYTCGDETVEQTRTIETTDYELVDSEWVEGETTTVTETRERDLTADEIEALDCPTTVVTTPPAAKSLAYTGSNPLLIGIGVAGGLALLLLGAAALAWNHFRPRYRRTNK